MATRMAATPTTVARWMPVPIAVPLAAVGAREKVAPHCVTASATTPAAELLLVQTCVYLFSRTAWSQRKLRVAVHSPQCEECTAMLSFSWFPAVREKRYAQDCAHAKGSFRTILDGDYSPRRATSLRAGRVGHLAPAAARLRAGALIPLLATPKTQAASYVAESVARSPHLDMLPQVVWAGAQRQRPYDKDVLKNKDFLNR